MIRVFRKLFLLTIFVGLLACNSKSVEKVGSSEVNIIPVPNKILKRGGNINLTNKFWIIANVSDSTSSVLASYLVRSLKRLTGEEARITDLYSTRKHDQSIQIELEKGNSFNSEEAYILDISSSQIKIKSKSAQGIYYGFQTLLQFLKAGSNNTTYTIPKMVIKDSPKFPIRGVILKTSQISKHTIENLFKSMVALKMNSVFLLEDGGENLSLKNIARKNYLKLFTASDLHEELTVISYGTSILEKKEVYNSKFSNSNSHGLVLDLTSTNEEDIPIKIVLLAELSWSNNDKKDFTRIKHHIKKLQNNELK